MTERMRAWCILGSNVGNSIEHLRRATFLLADTDGIDVLAGSHIYETPPWGRENQPVFLNAAIELSTNLEPEDLLNRFQEVERTLGRRRETEERWGPRIIDLDMALYGDHVVKSTRLNLPHPHLAERAFALIPLLEIVPDLCDPARGGMPLVHALEQINPAERQKCKLTEPLAWKIESLENTHSRPDFLQPDTILFLSKSPEDTEQMAADIGKHINGGEVLSLIGNLGAGKTCFARGLAHGLGVIDKITSPSYVLVKSYEGRLMFHHADFYRLTAGGSDTTEPLDLTSLGLEDYLEDSKAITLVEWADHFPSWVEPPFRQIEITGSGDGPRLLCMKQIRQ